MNALALIGNEKLQALAEEIEAIVVEQAYVAQSAKLDLFWYTGEAINKFVTDNDVNITEVVQTLANDNRLSGKQMGERNLWWCVKIFDAFPKREFPDDKAASLTKIKKHLSAGGKEPAECLHEEVETVCRCKTCHKIL